MENTETVIEQSEQEMKDERAMACKAEVDEILKRYNCSIRTRVVLVGNQIDPYYEYIANDEPGNED